MNGNLLDKTGAPVTVALDAAGPIGFYTVSLADGPPVGHARFIDLARDGVTQRIFFHTEVDNDAGGRGLGRLLVREALENCMLNGLEVVPVCPLFARVLEEDGDRYVAAGGRFRAPRPADIALVQRAVGIR